MLTVCCCAGKCLGSKPEEVFQYNVGHKTSDGKNAAEYNPMPAHG